MLFYFTGTGNSLYIAKQIDPNAISIPQAIHNDDLHFKDETIGIVCPVYGSEAPRMVWEFMSRAKFETDYFYVIMTYGGLNGTAQFKMSEFCKENGIRLDYFGSIRMVDNYLPAFDMDKQRAIDKKIDEQFSRIMADIKQRRHWLEPPTEQAIAAYERLQRMAVTDPAHYWKNITLITADGCVGCGLCTKVCPSACIRVVDGRAVHDAENCQLCYACIHCCPHKAVRLSVQEPNPDARFLNEHVTIADIIAANNQSSRVLLNTE